MSEQPVVVDSFYVDDGRVRAFDRHVRRFAASCEARHGVDARSVEEFARASASTIPSEGQWFPRWELAAANGWRPALRMRPAPPRTRSATVWLPATTPQRAAPAVKGPDLAMLADLRERARRAGADEALLCTPDGQLLETSQSNVLWWRGDVLCSVPDDSGVLPGITCGLLLELAAANGFEVRRERVRPVDLDGFEVWLANALHGIRVVTGWIGAAAATSITVPASTRAPVWSQLLDDVATPLR